jgi:hypothetical protein
MRHLKRTTWQRRPSWKALQQVAVEPVGQGQEQEHGAVAEPGEAAAAHEAAVFAAAELAFAAAEVQQPCCPKRLSLREALACCSQALLAEQAAAELVELGLLSAGGV